MKRKEFLFLFDIADGNPNGDPDADNHPRIDAETAQGLITDGCVKRKVRNYVDQTRSGQPGFRIYVKSGAILNQLHNEAYRENALDLGAAMGLWRSPEAGNPAESCPLAKLCISQS